MPKKYTIAELEAILSRDDEEEIEILPNGTVRMKGKTKEKEVSPLKILTFRDNLGGEYA